MASMLLGMVGGMGLSGVAQIPLEILNYELNKVAQHKPFDPNTLSLALKRGEISPEVYLEEFKKNGFTEEKSTQFYNITMSTQGIAELITRFRRGFITMEQAEKEAEFINFSPEQFHKIEEATRYIFTPQDLITWLVREVFTPKIRERFRQDDEFPEAAIEQAAKLGMDEETLKNYWAAHWQLPSIQEGYNMLFRFRPEDRAQWEPEMKELGLVPDNLETNLDDLVTLQRTQDMNPFWRPKQLGIAFRPLTIRMLRQQVRLRIKGYENTVYQFKKMGFSDNDSKFNTWFSLIFESLTDWKDGLKNKEITEEAIRTEMNIWQIPIDIQDRVWKNKLEPSVEGQISSEKEIVKGEVKKRFMLDLDTREEALEQLDLLKYNEKAAKLILEVWELEKEGKGKKERLLSKADLFKSYNNGIRSLNSLRDGLEKLRYSREAADELIRINDKKQSAKKEKTKA